MHSCTLCLGVGSTLRFAKEVIAGLHQIIVDFKLQTGLSRVRLLDVPCGDMAWMHRFLKTRDDVDYTGIDIVPELIYNHKKSYDIILCRMMLQHLYITDVLKLLKRFSDSGSHYLLTTNFYTVKGNADLSKTPSKARFRLLNLETPPFFLAPPKCIFRDGKEDKSHDILHFLGLWDLPLRKIRDCSVKVSFDLPGGDITIYSCTNWAYSQPANLPVA